MPGRTLIDDDEAARISGLIDEDLKQEYIKRRDARRREVKVMMLGQAESGKSTLQKQFQLFYASQSLEHERPSWRPVVYLNIITAVRMILDNLDMEETMDSNVLPDSSSELSQMIRIASPVSTGDLRGALLPLVAIEDQLASQLSGGVDSLGGGLTGAYVRPGWQERVDPAGISYDGHNTSKDSKEASMIELTELTARTLTDVWETVMDLWRHPAVRRKLQLRKLRLEEAASFFLDNVQRIAEPDYLPTTEDILNVRLQTLGVAEHRYDVVLGGVNYNWLMYDVGGARGMRHAWVPFFDDATAIIFLAPISAFDQYLDEDSRTNRIDDSLQLFTAICSNKLLKNAHLVLLLNKADLLKRKLEAGIKIRKYITSYGDRRNTYEEASEYFRAHFIQIHRKKDAWQRALYVHFTSMIDVKATQDVIGNVGEAVIRSHIAQTGLT
ncbi:G-alpha-domain-containing protein [Athelia psychrophila]|uniref:G-alpha-domain-containing protein n=1 Tax=Athelia psychrophila TaxID=1759441 RepID=A0A166KX82_9AGAM|nr:G-alpha-domain-containing protein [Fibularhizoctonia sp. CBS 109695]